MVMIQVNWHGEILIMMAKRISLSQVFIEVRQAGI